MNADTHMSVILDCSLCITRLAASFLGLMVIPPHPSSLFHLSLPFGHLVILYVTSSSSHPPIHALLPLTLLLYHLIVLFLIFRRTFPLAHHFSTSALICVSSPCKLPLRLSNSRCLRCSFRVLCFSFHPLPSAFPHFLLAHSSISCFPLI